MKLRAMTPEEFVPWRALFVRSWGEDLAKADDLPLAEAVAVATQRTDSDLPHGPATKNHFLFVLLEVDQPVGTLWFSIDPATKRAFLDDVEIAPALRGKGHGRKALALLEQEASKRGCTHVELNVYRHNAGAIALYEKLGYETSRLAMRKKL